MYCTKCNLALEGARETRCPRCGTAFDTADTRCSREHSGSRWRTLIVSLCVFWIILHTAYILFDNEPLLSEPYWSAAYILSPVALVVAYLAVQRIKR